MTKRKKSGREPRATDLLNSGLQHHQAGRLAEAGRIYEEVLALDPQNVNALHLLGLVEFHSGQREAGIGRLVNIVAMDSANVRALNDLGNMRSETGALDEAERLFREIIRHDPKHADAHNSLGVCLKDQGRIAAAVAEYRKAIELQPRAAGFHQNLGHALKLARDWGEAESAFRQVAELVPTDQDSYRNLGIVLRHQGRMEEAKKAFQRMLDLDPESAVARHLVAACDTEMNPDRAESGYVREVFDEFAETFESHLGELGYDAPEWTGRVVQKHLPAADSSLSILDAGCGTGLCGPFLKPLAAKLIGIDLSPKMLAKAAQKESYDELLAGDLVDYLRGHENALDVIVAADTFNYFGELDTVFAASAAALTGDGLLLFTLEHDTEDSDVPYRLFPHGRFGHSLDYVTELLGMHNLSVVEQEERTLRIEANAPVPGLFLAARRSTGQ